MRRPFACLGFSAFAALILAAWVGPGPVPVLCLIGTGLGLCALFLGIGLGVRGRRAAKRENIKQREKLPGALRPGASLLPRCLLAAALALLTAGLFLFRYDGAWKAGVAPVEGLAGTEAQIRGRVLDYPEEQYHKAYYLVRVERVARNGEAFELPAFTVRLSTELPLSCRPYDTLEGTVSFYAFSQDGGLYSGRNSRLADGVVLGAYPSGYGSVSTLPAAESPPAKLFAELRHTVGRSFQRLLPKEEAGLLRAMLLGDRNGLSDTAYYDFKQLGASHLLVISGLHMAAMAAFLSLLFGRLPLGRVGRSLLTAGTLLCFLALTGFPVSAVRSGVMFLVYLLANCFGREPDGVNSLGFAVLLLCLWKPFSGGDLGLALSVTATLGILVAADRFTRGLLRPFRHRLTLHRVMTPVAASLGVTFAVLLFTLPIQILVFGGVPLLAPLANLVLVFPCTLLLYAAFAAALLGLLPLLAPLAAPFAFCAGWLARFALWAAHGLAGLRSAFFDLGQGTWLIVLGACLLLGFLITLLKDSPKTAGLLALGMAVLVAAGGVFEGFRWQGVVTVAAAEDSSCVLVMKEGRAAVLSLGGFRADTAVSLLSRNNIQRVETLCLPVRDAEAREAAVRVLNLYGADRLALPASAYLGRDLVLAGRGAERCYLRDGGSFEALEGVEVSVSGGFSRLSFTGNGIPVAVETAGSGEGSCGLLLTNQRESRIHSSFTVLLGDSILEEEGPGFSREVFKLQKFPGGDFYGIIDANGSFASMEKGRRPFSSRRLAGGVESANDPFSPVGGLAYAATDGTAADWERFGELAPGNYLLPGRDGLYFDLFPDGSMGVRGESQCPRLEKAN